MRQVEYTDGSVPSMSPISAAAKVRRRRRSQALSQIHGIDSQAPQAAEYHESTSSLAIA